MIIRALKIAAALIAFILIAGLSTYLTIFFIIKGEDTVVVPELKNRDVIYVLEIMTDLGLNLKVKSYEYDPTVPKNHVVYQDPEPGTEIKKGRDVRITISKGHRMVLIPNLIGLGFRQAKIILTENDLQLDTLSKTLSETVEGNTVMAQVPTPGSNVPKSSGVNLLVSAGPPLSLLKMIDLKRLSLEEAIARIENNRLRLGKIQAARHPDIPVNTIVGQTPLFGYPVAEGTVVNLIVNRPPGTSTHDARQGEDRYGLFRYRTNNGFLNTHVRIKVNTDEFSYDMFDDYVKPGNELWLFISHENDSTVFVYENHLLVQTRIFNAW